jgi:SLT domain-containing protein
MANGYGVGLFDSKGPKDFAAAIDKIVGSLTGVQTAFTSLGTTSAASISKIASAVTDLTSKLSNLQSQMKQVQTAGPGGGGGGGGMGGGGQPMAAPGGGGASGQTGAAGAGATGGLWVPGRYAPTGNTGASTPLSGMDPNTAQNINPARQNAQEMPGGTPADAVVKQNASQVKQPAGGGGLWGQAATTLGPALAGGAANAVQSGAVGGMISTAVQGATIGQMLGPSFGVSAKSMYVIPKGTLAQSAGDYAQANYYAAMNMGVAPGTANWSTVQQGANQLMTLVPGMTRQGAMAAQNQMQAPQTLNAALGVGLNLRPGGQLLKPEQQYAQIFNRLTMGGSIDAKTFEAMMQPGAPGQVNLQAIGITPGSDAYYGFMQYAQTRLGPKGQAAMKQNKGDMPDVGTPKGAKAVGLDTPYYAQLQAQSSKSQMESRAEPGIASAAKTLNEAATKLLNLVNPLGSLLGSGIGGAAKLPASFLTNMIPGASLGLGVASKLFHMFQSGGPVPGPVNEAQLAVVHGGEQVVTPGMMGGGGLSRQSAGLAAKSGGHGFGTDSIAQMLMSKPTDIPNTALSNLLSPVSANSVLASITAKGAKPGAAPTTVQSTSPAATAPTAPTPQSAYAWKYAASTTGPIDLSGMFATQGGKSSSTSTGSGGTGAGGASPGSGGAGATGSPPTGSVASWISKAMQVAGVSGSDWSSGLNLIIQHESSGNPNAKNLTDSNAAAGHPSQGLMQLIPSTFQSNAMPGYNTNILDPVSNIAAGIKYIESRYQGIGNVPGVASIAAGGPYKPYARGTQLVDRTQLAMLHRGEAVVPAADNYSSTPYNRGGASGGGTTVHLNFKAGSVVLQVPATSSQKDMEDIANQFVQAISKPQLLAAARSQ